MSEYIHEKILQEFIIENIIKLGLVVQYKNTIMRIVDARLNKSGTFWDLEGILQNGLKIPIEIEWITSNFRAHKHHKNENYNNFVEQKGVLLVLRKNEEYSDIQQISLLDTMTEAQFKREFKTWFKPKSDEYIDLTLKDFMVGKYRRDLPRIILYPLSKNARNNYFPKNQLYRKNATDPAVLGFKETGYDNNPFIRDLQPDDICLFIASDGTRCKRKEFIDKIKEQRLNLFQISGFKIENAVIDKRKKDCKIDELYWPDEVKQSKLIYPYICLLKDTPFIEKHDIDFPYIKGYSDNTWESFRSCIQYGEYREISPLDFALLISNL